MTAIQSIAGAGARAVTITLGSETYALPIEVIEGVLPWEPLTRVPRMPDFMAGIFTARGTVVPVVDLRVRLGLDASAADSNHRIVLVQIGETRVGFIVDRVKEVVWMPEERIERCVSMVSSADHDLMNGIANLEQGLVILLNPERVLTQKEQKRLAKAMEAGIEAGATKSAAA